MRQNRSEPARDRVDAHVDRWLPVLPELDRDVEGAVTRMQFLTKHLRRFKEQWLVDFDLQQHEYDTLHALAGRRGAARPGELADDLAIAPASVTGRLETLERRGLIVRTQSTGDRRRVDVELTEAGWQAWREAIGGVGREEHRLLGALAPQERRQLSDLLRRVMLAAEEREQPGGPGEPGG
ncbi:MarR family transcriptional regulator [Kitasatospora sp. RB6PN24]|uniref:MarR family winged helix-turn-helix transcriptional regulator n=1 Tax=Kitasatospora humi TaxID=2893891 RepID=UPI001E63FE5E|nr:MarR family transcriptional regulator [Kitasatospora humi]MCC9310830.1 MarR family transcriptional regulator [Kitasatospora humi]